MKRAGHTSAYPSSETPALPGTLAHILHQGEYRLGRDCPNGRYIQLEKLGQQLGHSLYPSLSYPGAQPPPVCASRSRYACLSRIRRPPGTRSAGQRFTGPWPLSASPMPWGVQVPRSTGIVRERPSPSSGVSDARCGLAFRRPHRTGLRGRSRLDRSREKIKNV